MELSIFGKGIKGNDHQDIEDSLLIDKKKNLFSVADGVTNPHGGKEAAIKSCKYLQKVFKGDLKDGFQKVNDLILKDREKRFIGYTTLTAANIEDGLLKICNVGDSPIYLANNERIFRMTGNDRIFGTASLSQSIGQEIISVHYSEEKFEPDMYVVLATDGVTDLVGKDEIHEIIKKYKIPRNIVFALLKRAGTKPTIYNDDKTVIVIRSKK